MRYLVLAATLLATPAVAALPEAAYTGPLLDRIRGGFSCVGVSINNPEMLVLPAIMPGHAKPGSYVYYDAAAGKCVFVSAP